MTEASLLGHAAEAVRIIRKSPQPADLVMSRYLRERKYIGASDRRFISAVVFTCLRKLMTCQAIQEAKGYDDVTSAAHALLEGRADDVVAGLADDVTSNTQAWLLDSTRERWGAAASDVWHALAEPAEVVLRVNERRAPREAILAALRKDGIACREGRWVHSAIVLQERVFLDNRKVMTEGFVEVQDEASQMVSIAAAPRPFDVVLDACAGAGGKALHVADLQRDRGHIIARDVDVKRLRSMLPRVHRAGLHSVIVLPIQHNERYDRLPKAIPREGFDVVLIDAPCTGMGTVRRMPMPKWTLTEDRLQRYVAKQRHLLHTLAANVKEGGVLLYATCSILPQENEHAVADFLAAHPNFALERLPDACAEACDAARTSLDAGMLQMDPHHHGTDGLFMARMRRAAHSNMPSA